MVKWGEPIQKVLHVVSVKATHGLQKINIAKGITHDILGSALPFISRYITI